MDDEGAARALPCGAFVVVGAKSRQERLKSPQRLRKAPQTTRGFNSSNRHSPAPPIVIPRERAPHPARSRTRRATEESTVPGHVARPPAANRPVQSRPEGWWEPGSGKSAPEGWWEPGSAESAPERLKSPLETHEVRLRGLPVHGRVPGAAQPDSPLARTARDGSRRRKTRRRALSRAVILSGGAGGIHPVTEGADRRIWSRRCTGPPLHGPSPRRRTSCRPSGEFIRSWIRAATAAPHHPHKAKATPRGGLAPGAVAAGGI
jgi:hypothetical protein